MRSGAVDATASNGSNVARISVATSGTDFTAPGQFWQRSAGLLASVLEDHICHVELQELGAPGPLLAPNGHGAIPTVRSAIRSRLEPQWAARILCLRV